MNANTAEGAYRKILEVIAEKINSIKTRICYNDYRSSKNTHPHNNKNTEFNGLELRKF